MRHLSPAHNVVLSQGRRRSHCGVCDRLVVSAKVACTCARCVRACAGHQARPAGGPEVSAWLVQVACVISDHPRGTRSEYRCSTCRPRQVPRELGMLRSPVAAQPCSSLQKLSQISLEYGDGTCRITSFCPFQMESLRFSTAMSLEVTDRVDTIEPLHSASCASRCAQTFAN